MHPEFTCVTRERLHQTLQGKVTEATGATHKAILKYLRPPAKQASQSLAKMPTNNQDKLQLQDSGNAQLAVQLRCGIDGLLKTWPGSQSQIIPSYGIGPRWSLVGRIRPQGSAAAATTRVRGDVC